MDVVRHTEGIIKARRLAGIPHDEGHYIIELDCYQSPADSAT